MDFTDSISNSNFRVGVTILILVLCLSCNAGDKNQNTQISSLTISVLDDDKHIPLSTISSTSRYLVIDTTGGNYISRIKFIRNAGSDYLVVDDREVIYIIDHTGKVKNRFQHIGKGPGEYLDIAAITVDPKTQDIYLRCRQMNKLIRYSDQGNMLTEILIDGYYIGTLTFWGSNLVGLSSFPSFLFNARSPEFVFIFDQNLNIIHTENHPTWTVSESQYIFNPLMGIKSWQVRNGLVFYEMYQNGRFYIIDPVNEWTIQKWIEIDLEDQLSDDKIVEADGYLSNPGIFSGSNYIESVVVTPDLLFLNVVHGNIFENWESVLYNRKTNTFTSVKDFAGYPRLWDDVNGFFSFWPSGYLSQSKELYYVQQPGKMIQEYNEAIDPYIPGTFMETDPEIINLMEEAKEIGNPVIQLVTLEG